MKLGEMKGGISSDEDSDEQLKKLDMKAKELIKDDDEGIRDSIFKANEEEFNRL